MERNETWQHFRTLEQPTVGSETSIVICAKNARWQASTCMCLVAVRWIRVEEDEWKARAGSSLFQRMGVSVTLKSVT